MELLKFETGELVKLGPMLWSDVIIITPDGWRTYTTEHLIENQMALYVEYKDIDKKERCHKILFGGKFYIIIDNSYAIDEDSKRNIQKVLL